MKILSMHQSLERGLDWSCESENNQSIDGIQSPEITKGAAEIEKVRGLCSGESSATDE